MNTNKHILYAAFLLALSLLLLPGVAAAQQMKTLSGHVPKTISRLGLQPAGELDPNTNLTLAISLPPQNEQGLNALISQVYDPASSNYHHFLKPGEFATRFGPSAEDYQKVIDFAQGHHLSVIGAYSNRTLLDVRGKVSDIQNAFGVKFHTYHHPTENRDFYAPDTDPTVSADLPISHVSGLNNYFIPHPAFIKQSVIQSGANKRGLGSGPNGEYMGNDFRAAYVPGVALNGAGQNVALFELDGYFNSDILAYEQQAGLPSLTLTNISVDGGVPNPTPFGDPEVSLDIEMVISMATNLSEVIVYEAPNQSGGPVVDELNRIASDDLAAQISSSWLIGDDPSFDVCYKQMAVQGQSFFQCSGDNGAFYSNDEQVQQYADDTNVTIVGGTTLSTTGPGGSWASETVWNWNSTGLGTDAGGGGTNWNGILIPSWQQSVNMATNQGSTVLRNVPDVALTADNIYVIFEEGFSGYFGGTSCATPLWAAYTALVNQQALANGRPTVGFLNPAIYTIGQSANYTNCFHDITTGNNTNSVVSNKYFAVPGYDLATGWGTPNGSNLINALTGALDTNTIYTHLSAPLPPYGTQMANLNGSNPNGNWYLFVQDDEVINSGIISNGWSVALTTANPIGYVADDYLAMTASATNLVLGQNVTFYVGITNFGPNTSSNVVVQDAIPSGFLVLSNSATLGSTTVSGQTLTWNVTNTLVDTVGAQLQLTLQPTGNGTAINSAQVSAATPNQNPADGSAAVVVNVNPIVSPTLSSTALGAGGQFQLTVSGVSAPVTIQASTNLVNWVNVWTNDSASFTYTNSVNSGYPHRFFRAIVP